MQLWRDIQVADFWWRRRSYKCNSVRVFVFALFTFDNTSTGIELFTISVSLYGLIVLVVSLNFHCCQHECFIIFPLLPTRFLDHISTSANTIASLYFHCCRHDCFILCPLLSRQLLHCICTSHFCQHLHCIYNSVSFEQLRSNETTLSCIFLYTIFKHFTATSC